jgi:predicted metal-binding membrane protein
MVTSQLKLYCQVTSPSHRSGYYVYHLVFIQGGVLRIWEIGGLLLTGNEPSGSTKFRVFHGYLRTLASPARVCCMQMAVVYLRVPPVPQTVLSMTGQQ